MSPGSLVNSFLPRLLPGCCNGKKGRRLRRDQLVTRQKEVTK